MIKQQFLGKKNKISVSTFYGKNEDKNDILNIFMLFLLFQVS